MSDKENSKKLCRAGMKSGIPIIFGFIPVGIAYAIMARHAGFSAAETVFMSAAVFAGASQMMAVGMYAQGASVVALILTTFILNLRHLIMSTCIMNKMRSEKNSMKLLAAFGVTDESFAVFTTEKQENCTMSYFLGLISVTYLSWVTGSAIGAFASDFLPTILTASLGIALYAMFIALLMPNLKHNFRLGLLAAFTAVMNTVLSRFIASSWAMIASTLICAAIGVFFVDLDEKEVSADEN
ncbi:MAG: AzlC family ABC transporter permease [Oscillospiraceae bacterium]|nr:AzlC family ABC transporter permease [Oscillospiraceae bacterium]